MTLETVITIKDAPLYRSSGKADGGYVPDGTVLECDWIWTSGDLKGKRRINSPEVYLDKFINATDVAPYIPPVEPPPTEATLKYIIKIHEDGTVFVLDNSGTILWQSG